MFHHSKRKLTGQKVGYGSDKPDGVVWGKNVKVFRTLGWKGQNVQNVMNCLVGVWETRVLREMQTMEVYFVVSEGSKDSSIRAIHVINLI